MAYQLTTAKIWDGAAWQDAIGGSIQVEYLVIAGGGGGGNGSTTNLRRGGAGGGAGGYVCAVVGEQSPDYDPSVSGTITTPRVPLKLSGTYPLVVGAGGANLVDGSYSMFAGIFAFGGGGGRTLNYDGAIGGSGAGGAVSSGSSTDGGAGFPLQGHYGSGGGNDDDGGAGGGAGTTPVLHGANNGDDGGAGLDSAITGSSIFRAGGGGGAGVSGQGAGGSGGGGTGAGASLPATAGDPNTGGGGGGGDQTPRLGQAGGSGVVIFSVLTGTPVSFSGGVTQTSAVDGVNTVYSVTATSTTSETVTIG
jgi:hypothetical protein